jgi:uncharacterized protein
MVAPAKSFWHPGELALQRTVGSEENLARHAHRIFLDHLNPQHRAFYPRLPFLVAGTVDSHGSAWATILSGRPGFAASPDPYKLSIEYRRNPDDPAEEGMEDGNSIALLGIELHTRRRNRLNGTIRRNGSERFDAVVGQAYGNCPQYIHLRDFEFVREPSAPAPDGPRSLATLDDRANAVIHSADTFFVASYADLADGSRQVDVSHRGGDPGFVRLDERGVLTVPDFAGNQFFNTLGNIRLNGQAGLVFVDFKTGDVLQLSGEAEVLLDSPEIASFESAERLWRFTPRHIVYRAGALPLRWKVTHRLTPGAQASAG